MLITLLCALLAGGMGLFVGFAQGYADAVQDMVDEARRCWKEAEEKAGEFFYDD